MFWPICFIIRPKAVIHNGELMWVEPAPQPRRGAFVSTRRPTTPRPRALPPPPVSPPCAERPVYGAYFLSNEEHDERSPPPNTRTHPVRK